MTALPQKPRRKVTPRALMARKDKGDAITMVTAYDYPFALFAEQAGIDVVFVSDAFASVGLGRENNLSVTVEEVVYHTRAAKRGVEASLLLASLPFLSYTTPSEAIQSAKRLVQEAGADAVEVEGEADTAPVVRALTNAGVAVVGHVGLTKTITARTGSYRAQGQEPDSAISVIQDALSVVDAGAFALVLECIPDRIAAAITQLVRVPTIGIGAGVFCDGQALLSQDMLGIFEKYIPRFVHKFANLGEEARNGFRNFRQSVRSAEFPGASHTLRIDDDTLETIVSQINNAAGEARF